MRDEGENTRTCRAFPPYPQICFCIFDIGRTDTWEIDFDLGLFKLRKRESVSTAMSSARREETYTMLQDVVELTAKTMQDNLVRADDLVAAAYCHVKIVTSIEQSLEGHKEPLVSARYLCYEDLSYPCALSLC